MRQRDVAHGEIAYEDLQGSCVYWNPSLDKYRLSEVYHDPFYVLLLIY